MIPAVFDCGVLVSAIGWSGNPRRCLMLVAHRQIRLFVTSEIWEEYETRIPVVLSGRRPGVNARPTLDWLQSVAHFVNPAPLGPPRSRDLKDDRYLACALGAGAKWLVSNDRDLLSPSLRNSRRKEAHFNAELGTRLRPHLQTLS